MRKRLRILLRHGGSRCPLWNRVVSKGGRSRTRTGSEQPGHAVYERRWRSEGHFRGLQMVYARRQGWCPGGPRRTERGGLGNEAGSARASPTAGPAVQSQTDDQSRRSSGAPDARGRGTAAPVTEPSSRNRQPRGAAPKLLASRCLIAAWYLPCACLVSPMWIGSTWETQGRHKAPTP